MPLLRLGVHRTNQGSRRDGRSERLRRGRGAEGRAASPPPPPPPGSPFRGMRRAAAAAMDRRLKRSRLRFASAMSSIVEKYNFPFDDDLVVSIKSLTYSTSDGPKVWGEESDLDCTDTSYQSFEEEQFTDSFGDDQPATEHKTNAELASIKRHLENIHIKENIPLICYSGTPVKNKYRVQMDMLLDDGTSSAPEVVTVTGTRARNVHQWSPLQELDNNSSIGCYPDVFEKQMPSTDEHSTLLAVPPANSSVSSSADGIVKPENISLWGGNENGFNSFLEMYESADEHCSWSNVTIADLYPGMVKALSRLLHKASSSSLIKRYKYGYWHPKKTKLNTTTERIKKYRLLKLKSSLTTTGGDQKRHKLAMATDGSNGAFDYGKHHCSVNNVTRTEPSISCAADDMEIDSSGIAEDIPYTENIRQGSMDITIIPSEVSTGETFLVKTPTRICLPSDCVRKGHTSEKCYPIDCTVVSEKTCNLTTEDNPEEISAMTFKTTSSLSLSLNSSTNSCLQKNTSSLVKISNRLLGNHEIKMHSAAVSLQRSHSLSSLPVSRRPGNVHQSCEGAFEKMYKELCSPKLQKTFKFSNICKSPRKSAELHTSGFSASSKCHEKPNDAFENIYQKLCSEGFPKIPIFLRVENLKKKYEGVHMSETVNALVNSPLRTVPAVARNKRAANFCKEDFQPSPIKRLKNIPENSSYRICQKTPCWKNVNIQKADTTFTLYTPNINNWLSNMDSGFSVSTSHNFLFSPRTDMKESRIADVDENCLHSCMSLRKSPNCKTEASRNLSYNDGRARKKNDGMEALVCKGYKE